MFIDQAMLERWTEALFCRLDKLERCCQDQGSLLRAALSLQSASQGEVRIRSIAILPSNITQLTEEDARRRVLIFSGEVNDKYYILPRNDGGSDRMIVDQNAGPLIFLREHHDPLQRREWWCQSITGGPPTICEVW